MPVLSCSFYRAIPPAEDRKHCSGIDWLSACGVIALLILDWKYIFFPLLLWKTDAVMRGSRVINELLPLWGWLHRGCNNDSVDHLTLSWGLHYTFSAPPNFQSWDRVNGNTLETNGRMMKPWAQDEVKKKTGWPQFWSNFSIPERHFIRFIYKSVNAHILQACVVFSAACPAVKQCHIHSAPRDLTRGWCKLKWH